MHTSRRQPERVDCVSRQIQKGGSRSNADDQERLKSLVTSHYASMQRLAESLCRQVPFMHDAPLDVVHDVLLRVGENPATLTALGQDAEYARAYLAAAVRKRWRSIRFRYRRAAGGGENDKERELAPAPDPATAVSAKEQSAAILRVVGKTDPVARCVLAAVVQSGFTVGEACERAGVAERTFRAALARCRERAGLLRLGVG